MTSPASIATSTARSTRCCRRRRRRSRTRFRRGGQHCTATFPRQTRRDRRARSRIAIQAFAIASWRATSRRRRSHSAGASPGTMHPDTPGLDMLATVLGAVARRASIAPCASASSRRSLGAYNYTPTRHRRLRRPRRDAARQTADAARAIWDQLRRVRDEGVGELEVERAKRIYESRWVRRLEDMEGQANYLAEWEALGDWDAGRTLPRAPADHDARSDPGCWRDGIFDPDQAAIIVYRPKASPEVARDAEAMRELLDGGTADHSPERSAAPSRSHARRRASGLRTDGGGRARLSHVLRHPGARARQAGSPLVHAGLFVLGGPSDERDAIAGLTLLMARTALKGTTAPQARSRSRRKPSCSAAA